MSPLSFPAFSTAPKCRVTTTVETLRFSPLQHAREPFLSSLFRSSISSLLLFQQHQQPKLSNAFIAQPFLSLSDEADNSQIRIRTG